MLTVELLGHALALAESLGYGVRHEWLGGCSGGVCQIAGKRWLFVDLALNPIEQLEQVAAALRQDVRIHSTPMPESLQRLLEVRRAA
jgi:hypothetical protein